MKANHIIDSSFGSVLIIGVVFSLSARGDVIFNNYGPGVCGGVPSCIAVNGINQNGSLIAGQNQTFQPGITQMIANAFTSGGNFTLTSVMLPLQATFAGGMANLYLTTDNGGSPGTTIESWLGVTGEPFAVPQANSITLNSATHPSLLNSTTYWLVVGPASNVAALSWNLSWPIPGNFNNSNQLSNRTPDGSGIPTLAGPWTSGDLLTNAFQINGTPQGTSTIPEPSTISLLCIGFVGLVGISLRRRMSGRLL